MDLLLSFLHSLLFHPLLNIRLHELPVIFTTNIEWFYSIILLLLSFLFSICLHMEMSLNEIYCEENKNVYVSVYVFISLSIFLFFSLCSLYHLLSNMLTINQRILLSPYLYLYLKHKKKLNKTSNTHRQIQTYVPLKFKS